MLKCDAEMKPLHPTQLRLSHATIMLVCFGGARVATAVHGREANTDESKVILEIRKRMGTVIRDDSRPGRPVIEVNLFEADIDDGDLHILKPLTSLRRLTLGCYRRDGCWVGAASRADQP